MADIISLSSLVALAVLLPWLWFRHRKALREEAAMRRKGGDATLLSQGKVLQQIQTQGFSPRPGVARQCGIDKTTQD